MSAAALPDDVVSAPPFGRLTRALRIVVPALLTLLFLGLLWGFVALNELDGDKFRSYGGTWFTDHLPLKETQFFLACVFLGGGAIWSLGLLLSRTVARPLARIGAWCVENPWKTVLAAAGFALGATALISWLALQHTPTLLDEMWYLFQVELLRDGKLYTDLPSPLEPWKDFYSVQAEGIWTGIYPWGHVAVLLPGVLLGFPQLMPHVWAALAVILTYLLGRELFTRGDDDRASPVIGAALVATSPFIAFTCGSMHNVSTSMVLGTFGLFALVRSVRRTSLLWAALSGLAFGFGLHGRAYNAIAFAAPAGLAALLVVMRQRGPWLKLALAFVVGLLPGIAAYLAINVHVTGDAMMTPAQMSMPEGMRIMGFGDDMAHGIPHTPVLAFGKQGTNLIRLSMWTSGSIVTALAMLGMVLGLRKRRSDLFLLLPVFGLFAFYYWFYTSPGYDTGPLYYMDAVPLLALVTARTLVALGDRAESVGITRERYRGWAMAGGVAAIVVAFATWWPIQGLAVNKVTDNTKLPYDTVEKAGIRNAVVWFNGNPWRRSWSLPPKPPRYDLSDDVLYARYDRHSAPILWEKYRQTRKFYRLKFETGRTYLEPWIYVPDTVPFGPPKPFVYEPRGTPFPNTPGGKPGDPDDPDKPLGEGGEGGEDSEGGEATGDPKRPTVGDD